MIDPATAIADAPGASTDSTATAPYAGAAPRGHVKSRFTIPGPAIALATAGMPDRARAALRWIADHCERRNISHRDVAGELKQPGGESYSSDSLYHALTGSRTGGSLDNIVRAIEQFRAKAEGEAITSSTFIPTVTSRKIAATCRRARTRCRPVFVFGGEQIGKTTGFEEVQRQAATGDVHLIRVPTGGAPSLLIAEIARVLRVNSALRGPAVRQGIFDCVDAKMLLIFDDCQECFDGEGRKCGRNVNSLNFIKEIWDRKKCGIVLSGTPLFKQGILHSKEAASLRQLWRRSILPLELPAEPSRAELAQFARAYGLDAAPDEVLGVNVTSVDDEGEAVKTLIEKNPLELQTESIRRDGLGRWKMLLEEAADLAREKRKTVSWGMVLHVWHTFTATAQAGQGGAS